jgi:hypothetical protein
MVLTICGETPRAVSTVESDWPRDSFPVMTDGRASGSAGRLAASREDEVELGTGIVLFAFSSFEGVGAASLGLMSRDVFLEAGSSGSTTARCVGSEAIAIGSN